MFYISGFSFLAFFANTVDFHAVMILDKPVFFDKFFLEFFDFRVDHLDKNATFCTDQVVMMLMPVFQFVTADTILESRLTC